MSDRFAACPLPIVRPIPKGLTPAEVFEALSDLPGRVWLDSATAAIDGPAGLPVDPIVSGLSRYSFLSADPVLQFQADPTDPDPWAELSRLAKRLPGEKVGSLPPFQGGLIGVLAYEAVRWLEPVELAGCDRGQTDDLPTPAIAFGVYDWVIAFDHDRDESWLISQGLSAEDFDRHGNDPIEATLVNSDRLQRATDRADQILDRLSGHQARGRRSSRRRQDLGIDEPSCGTSFYRQNPFVIDGFACAVDRSRCAIESNFTGRQFRDAVSQIVQRIRNGDSFQVNLAQRLTTEVSSDAASIYLRLRETNPAPFAGFFDGGDFQVLSSSPEGFLQLRDRKVTTRPIKGTVPRTGDPETDRHLADVLSASEKDRAENLMIVDLMRNDLSRVCEDQSVTVTKLCQIERYQCVQHLVSVVEGCLRRDADVVDLLRACFPGGSVTGAPKIEAMKTIAELEPNPRGPYCGSLGYISCGGDADFNILIRTMTRSGGRLQIPVGGGITARSDPAAEEAETWAKAKGMLDALAGAYRQDAPWRPLDSKPSPAAMHFAASSSLSDE